MKTNKLSKQQRLVGRAMLITIASMYEICDMEEKGNMNNPSYLKVINTLPLPPSEVVFLPQKI